MGRLFSKNMILMWRAVNISFSRPKTVIKNNQTWVQILETEELADVKKGQWCSEIKIRTL